MRADIKTELHAAWLLLYAEVKAHEAGCGSQAAAGRLEAMIQSIRLKAKVAAPERDEPQPPAPTGADTAAADDHEAEGEDKGGRDCRLDSDSDYGSEDGGILDEYECDWASPPNHQYSSVAEDETESEVITAKAAVAQPPEPQHLPAQDLADPSSMANENEGAAVAQPPEPQHLPAQDLADPSSMANENERDFADQSSTAKEDSQSLHENEEDLADQSSTAKEDSQSLHENEEDLADQSSTAKEEAKEDSQSLYENEEAAAAQPPEPQHLPAQDLAEPSSMANENEKDLADQSSLAKEDSHSLLENEEDLADQSSLAKEDSQSLLENEEGFSVEWVVRDSFLTLQPIAQPGSLRKVASCPSILWPTADEEELSVAGAVPQELQPPTDTPSPTVEAMGADSAEAQAGSSKRHSRAKAELFDVSAKRSRLQRRSCSLPPVTDFGQAHVAAWQDKMDVRHSLKAKKLEVLPVGITGRWFAVAEQGSWYFWNDSSDAVTWDYDVPFEECCNLLSRFQREDGASMRSAARRRSHSHHSARSCAPSACGTLTLATASSTTVANS